jgi:hypothetical protein
MKTKQLQPVTFGQAKRLRKLGFDWETDSLYFSDDKSLSGDYGFLNHNAIENDDDWTCEVYSAPTVALALKWFRDVKGIKNEVRFYYCSDAYTTYYYQGWFDCKNHEHLSPTSHFKTYEAAERALLDELLTI